MFLIIPENSPTSIFSVFKLCDNTWPMAISQQRLTSCYNSVQKSTNLLLNPPRSSMILQSRTAPNAEKKCFSSLSVVCTFQKTAVTLPQLLPHVINATAVPTGTTDK